MIRHRLSAAIVAAITAVIAITGLVVVNVLEDRLVAAIDEQLTAFAQQRARAAATPQLQDHGTPGSTTDGNHMAIVEIGTDDKILSTLAPGPTGAPESLPDVTGLTGPFRPRTLPSTSDDGPTYRAIGVDVPDGGTVVAALPLDQVESTLDETRRILLAAGGGALALTAAIVWLSIRRGLRPIDDMIAAAERIAAGDLTARTSVPDATTEVGHLSSALNTMLDRIQHAMATRAESEARMRRFVADASHELRTPLTSIRGYAELHRQGARDPDEVERGMARIEREAVHMETLVEDLLLLARLDQGRPLADEPVDLTRLVDEAVSNARAADPDRHITLKRSGHPTVVNGDAHRLRQILDNLLANIRDHTDPGTVATITLTDGGGIATLTVADDGPGMDAHEAEHAFDRFWQAEPTATRPRPGAGLGLPIVAQVIAAHDGTITLDTAPGSGTAVTITLPKVREQMTQGR